MISSPHELYLATLYVLVSTAGFAQIKMTLLPLLRSAGLIRC
jgi:hypothetical protein